MRQRIGKCLYYERAVTYRVLILVLFFFCSVTDQSWADWSYSEGTDTAPQVIMPWSNGRAIVTLPNGVVEAFDAGAGNKVYSVTSNNNGLTWGAPAPLFTGPGSEGFWTTSSMVTQNGEIQLFGVAWRDINGTNPNVNKFLDVWENSTTFGGQIWGQPKIILSGYVSALDNVTQLDNGRIVLPYPWWIPGGMTSPPTGAQQVSAMYSDNGGSTWTGSASQLTAPCYSGFNGENDGADEPAVVQLPNGQLWMLMRTQTGHLYQSFSTDDGATWSATTQSQFWSSSSPPQLLRLKDGRILMVWNNSDQSPLVNGQMNYGGRDELTAAISSDGGLSWKGFREIYLDPLRNSYPYTTNDRGTAYPTLTQLNNGNILMVTGQDGQPGEGREALVEFDPNWLTETHQEDDFSHGLNNWSVFTNYGPVTNLWQARTQGPELVANPDTGGMMLHVRRANTNPADGAEWNFPQGKQGTLEMKVKLNAGHQALNISLADHFYQPTDNNGSLFSLQVGSNGALPGGGVLQSNTWYILDFDWNTEAGTCKVLANNSLMTVLPLLAPTEGLSYLRLRSLATGIDMAGFDVSDVSVNVAATGDINQDGHVNAADILAMEQALTNLPAYQTANGLTNAQLLALGDINGDGVINNADLQSLINLLQSGGGSTINVPEPSTAILLLGAAMILLFAYRN